MNLRTWQELQDEPLYYDYELQVWVKDGIVAECGHTAEMGMMCNACATGGLSIAYAYKMMGKTMQTATA